MTALARVALVTSYLVFVVSGYVAVGVVVENEQDRAVQVETVACTDLREAVQEINERQVPHEVVRKASLHAVLTAERSARTEEAAKRYHESAVALRGAHFGAVELPDCGSITKR